MKLPQHIFALTKNEQRVVILILLGLLAWAIAKHFWEARSHISTPATAPSEPSVRPSPPPVEEDHIP